METLRYLVSGYTGANKPAIPSGIALYELNHTNNELENSLLWQAHIPSPSFLCTYNDMLFAVTEQKGSSIFYLFIATADGYELVDSITTEHGLVCHLSYLPEKQMLLGSSYEDGVIVVLRVVHKKKLLVHQFVRQEKNSAGLSRVHCTLANKAETYVYATNIADDAIYRYTFDASNLLQADRVVRLKQNTGPRHICFGASEDTLYVVSEYSNEIIVCHVDDSEGLGGSEGNFSVQQIVPVESESQRGCCFGSSLFFDKEARKLYVAMRGSNRVYGFEVASGTSLVDEKPAAQYDAIGIWPRHITLLGQRVLAVAAQESNEVVFVPLHDANQDIFRLPFEQASFVEEVI